MCVFDGVPGNRLWARGLHVGTLLGSSRNQAVWGEGSRTNRGRIATQASANTARAMVPTAPRRCGRDSMYLLSCHYLEQGSFLCLSVRTTVVGCELSAGNTSCWGIRWHDPAPIPCVSICWVLPLPADLEMSWLIIGQEHLHRLCIISWRCHCVWSLHMPVVSFVI